jgi:acyl-coenzyme A synthetase/AMP-(fatty) acid ligase
MIEWLGPVLFEFYGGTEGGGVSIDSPSWLAHPGSVGKPREGLGLEIRDDDGVPVPAGVEGHVWFRDGQRFDYKDDPEKTAGAVVQLVPEVDASPDLAEQLIAHCRTQLSGYQVPRAVDFDDALPRTETGKLARRTIRNRYWAGRERRI